MFFTPGRIIGMIVFTLVVLVIGVLLQRLDARISSPVDLSDPEPTPTNEPSSGISTAAPRVPRRSQPGRRKRGR